MFGERIRDAVGPGRPNKPEDVRIVQRLLDRNSILVGNAVRITGEFDRATEMAILSFQRRFMYTGVARGVIDPNDETFWRLSEMQPQRMLAGTRSGIIFAPFSGNASFQEEDFRYAAKELGCEVRAVKAVQAVESGKNPFDKMGRPTILFERHLFSRHTFHRYDSRFPLISNRLPGGYSTPSVEQYPRLQQAYALDDTAALRATSWGGFQILGDNFAEAGYSTVYQYVCDMCESTTKHVDAFVAFVKANKDRLRGLREKDWALFAKNYNGGDYLKNQYDSKLAKEYSNATEWWYFAVVLCSFDSVSGYDAHLSSAASGKR